MTFFSPWPCALDGRADLAALEQRRADLDVRAIGNEQHFVEVETVEPASASSFSTLQHAVLLNPILLATGGNDGVHEFADSDRKGRAF